jgi:hypothetical protein
MKTRISFLSVIIAGMAFTLPFATATHADDRVQGQDNIDRYSDQDRMTTAKDPEKKLERALKTGEPKNFYRREIENKGWQMPSANYDKPDYLEYEIVKGDDSYEVQIDFDKNSGKATKVDATVTHAHYLPAWFSFFRN